MKRWTKYLTDSENEAFIRMTVHFVKESFTDLSFVRVWNSMRLENMTLQAVKKRAVEAAVSGNTELIDIILKNKAGHQITPDFLDDLIECAIDNKQYEVYLMLVNYKHKNNLYQDWTKKFEL